MAKTKDLCSLGDDHSHVDSKKNNSLTSYVKIDELHAFKEHPFKVENDMELFELMRSIEKEGVIVPLLVRPNPYGNGYEIISSHRRKDACDWAGVKDIPVIIRELDNNQAVIAMVDSNLQREHIKPSEKAFAYKMKLEAMKQQGKRNDLTFSPLDKKLDEGMLSKDETKLKRQIAQQILQEIDNPTLELNKVEGIYDEEGIWKIRNSDNPIVTHSNEVLSKLLGESTAQLSRYIRLTYLIPKILDMVDEDKIAFRTAVELSYLAEEEQYELHAVMDLEQCTPSLAQANRIKRMSQSGKLTMDMLYQILGEEKTNQREKLKIYVDTLDEYFPTGYTPNQKVELIEKLVKEWHESQLQRKQMQRRTK